MVSLWSLSGRKAPKVSMTLLSILANFSIAVVWMVSTHPTIFKFSSPFFKPLGAVPSAPITIVITDTFMFYSFLSSLASSMYLSFIPFSLIFTVVRWDGKDLTLSSLSLFFFFFFFLLIITWSGFLVSIRWSVFISKSERILSYPPGRILVCGCTIWQYGQNSIFYIIHNKSPSPPNRVWSYTPFVLVCCIRLLCVWWFRLFHHIIYPCCTVAYYRFSLYYNWFFGHC